MEELLQESSFNQLKENTIICGIITEIRQTEVIIDFGGKAEGSVLCSEFPDIGELQIGEDLEVFLEKLENKDGYPILSYDKALQKKNWEHIEVE